MSPNDLDRAAAEVLARYDPPPRRYEPLGNAGGFSGARLWRVECADGDWCLKAWPPVTVSFDRLSRIHAWMATARAAELDFIPSVRRASDGSTIQKLGGRIWDQCAWMPGRADFHSIPTTRRMSAACAALARLHAVWARAENTVAPCRAVERRLAKLGEWEEAIRSGWQPDFASDGADPVSALARQAYQLLPQALSLTHELLGPLHDTSFRLHLCLGDVWHDHVLFTGDRVTGLIDYGAARVDTPAVDLARLVGSLAPSNDELYAHGLRSYQTLAPLTPEELRLVHVLDYTGTVLGAVNWLLWLYRDRRVFDDRATVCDRLRVLVERMQRMHRMTLPWRAAR